MKPVDFARRLRVGTCSLGILIGAVLWLIAPPVARAASDDPELSLVGATGVPGSTVSVALALSGDDSSNPAVGAAIDLTFDPASLDFFGQFASDQCTVEPSLSSNHAIIGRILSPGVLDLEVTPNPVIFPVVPLGDGNIASCKFHIKAAAAEGDSPLGILNPLLSNAAGQHLQVQTMGGSIIITNALPTSSPTVTPTPMSTATMTNTVAATSTRTLTPTLTATPTKTSGNATETPTITSTGTPTKTPVVTATVTVTNTPVATNTPVVTATASKTPVATATTTRTKGSSGGSSGGCDIVPVEQSSAAGTFALLLAPALLVWARRRSK